MFIFGHNGTPPRLWGKRVYIGANKRDDVGTPPRLWGKPYAICAGLHYLRYTPTPVGKTLAALVAANAEAGTPPRLWGKPFRNKT